MKKNFGLNKIGLVLIGVASLFLASVIEMSAQAARRVPQQAEESDDMTWVYILLTVLIVGLVLAIAWWFKKKKIAKEEHLKSQKGREKRRVRDADYLHMDKEMEW